MTRAVVVRCLYPFDERLRAELELISPRVSFRFTPPDGQAAVNDVHDELVDVLFSNYCPADLGRVPGLKWLALAGAGIEHLRALDPWARGVTVTNGSGLNATSMAEYALGAFLRFSQRFAERDAYQRNRSWPRPWAEGWVDLLGYSLRGRTVTIVGYGSVGREVARLAHCFGMRVLAVKARPAQKADTGYGIPGLGDPHGLLPERIVGVDGMSEAFSESQFIALTLPWTPATDRIVDESAISALPRDAVVVNVGRGRIVDEDALVAAVRNGSIRGAVLDVVSDEPLDGHSALWSTPGVVLTPHVSGINDPSGQWTSLARLLAENLDRFVNGGDLINVVDPRAGY